MKDERRKIKGKTKKMGGKEVQEKLNMRKRIIK